MEYEILIKELINVSMIVLIPSPYGHRDFQRQTHTRQSSPHMDESVFTSPLESNLNRLIFDQFSHWRTQFKQFLKFTDCKNNMIFLFYSSLFGSGQGIRRTKVSIT
jgi:hypothetical protein